MDQSVYLIQPNLWCLNRRRQHRRRQSALVAAPRRPRPNIRVTRRKVTGRRAGGNVGTALSQSDYSLSATAGRRPELVWELLWCQSDFHGDASSFLC